MKDFEIMHFILNLLNYFYYLFIKLIYQFIIIIYDYFVVVIIYYSYIVIFMLNKLIFIILIYSFNFEELIIYIIDHPLFMINLVSLIFIISVAKEYFMSQFYVRIISCEIRHRYLFHCLLSVPPRLQCILRTFS